MGVLSKFRKKGRGFQDKTRTKEEINQEYNHHIAMYGHGATLLEETRKNFEAAIGKAEAEQQRHLEMAVKLRAEAAALAATTPPEAPKTEAPTQEGA